MFTWRGFLGSLLAIGCGVLGAVGSPGSIGALGSRRVGSLYTRMHSYVVGAISRGNKRLSTGLNSIRLAMTLRHTFGSPRSTVVFSINRRYCARGLLANHFRRFGALERRGNLSNFVGPGRDRRSTVVANRDDGSVSTTCNVCHTGGVGKRGNSTITMVNSNTLANNVTCRTLGRTNSRSNGFVIILGSGRVSVSRGIKDVTHDLAGVHGGPHCRHFGSLFNGFLGGVPLVNGFLFGFFCEVGRTFGALICGGGLFRTFNFGCLNPISKRGIGGVRTLFGVTRNCSEPAVIRIMAAGNGKCPFTRGDPGDCRKISPFSVGRNTGRRGKASFSTVTKHALYSLTRGSDEVYTIATTVTDNANLSSFSTGFPRHFFSINVTRRRTIAFATNLTGNNVVPCFTICSSFLRHTCSRVVRSYTVNGIPIHLLVSHTNVINRSNRARRNLFSMSFLASVPGVAICSPACCRRLVCLVGLSTLASNIVTVHCPEKYRYIRSLNASCGPSFDIMGNSNGHIIISCKELFSRTMGTGARSSDLGVVGLGGVCPLSGRLVARLVRCREVSVFRRAMGDNNVNRRLSTVLFRGKFGNRFGVRTIGGRFMPVSAASTTLGGYNLSTSTVLEDWCTWGRVEHYSYQTKLYEGP